MKKILFLFAAFVASLSMNAQSLKAYSVYDVNQDDKESVSDVTAVVNQVKAAAATDKTVVDTEALLQVLTKLSTDIAAIKAKLCISDDPDPSSSNLLPGTFTVAKGKTVQFTKGNLYYSSTDSKYHLESAQNVTYNTLGQTAYGATHVCHFYWSNTTDWQTSGQEPWAETYSYSAEKTGDKFFCGVDNKMTVDGISGLYALSGGNDGEWYYLINTRDNASNLYKYGVSVTTSAGTEANCLIIAPDGYDYTAHPLQTSYDATEWTAAEALGLVCLPAAVFRDGSYLPYGGDDGCYWSSSPNAGNASTAYSLYFSSDYVDPADDNDRGNGYSLRLVK